MKKYIIHRSISEEYYVAEGYIYSINEKAFFDGKQPSDADKFESKKDAKDWIKNCPYFGTFIIIPIYIK